MCPEIPEKVKVKNREYLLNNGETNEMQRYCSS